MEIGKGARKFIRLLVLPSLFLAAIAESQGLKVRNVVVPSHEVKGKRVELECNYELNDDQLYSLKWYKGIKEFFRYVPADAPPMQVFDLPGVNVDLDKSSDTKVTLKEISLKTSGKYKCEVSAEAPSFHTDSGEGELLVVHMPEKGPQINGIRDPYHVGDLVQVNCTSSPSKPAASLMWYINEKQAESNTLVDHAPSTNSEGLEISTLGLRFRARAIHFRQGHLRLRCSATIAAVYYKDKAITVRGFHSDRMSTLESRGMYSGSAVPMSVTAALALWTVIGLLALR